MAVAVEQVAGGDLEASDFDGLPELDNVSVGVGDGEAAGEELKAQGADGGQVADGSIGHAADAVQGAGDLSVNFAKEGPDGAMIDVLKDQHTRLGQRRDIRPKVDAVVVTAVGHGW